MTGHELIAVARRPQASKRLGWLTIPARRVEGMSDEEPRALELVENTERLELDSYDRSKQRLAEIHQAEADLRREAEQAREKMDFRLQDSQKSFGRPPAPDSQRRVAERTGISRTTRQEIERHVEVAEQYPFMQNTEAGRRSTEC